MEIRINEEDHLKLLGELHHLRLQRDELQKSNTKLLLENRDYRAILRRVEEYPAFHKSEIALFAQLPPDTTQTVAYEEQRRASLWRQLRQEWK